MSLLDYNLTIHVFNGKDRKVFWFVIVKTEKRYYYPDKPHFNTRDARRICEGLTSKKINETMTFGNMWANCDIFTMTPLEEGYFKTWQYGRLVCIGDAVRKVSAKYAFPLASAN
jgi:FAD dependent monooxygenase